MKLSVTWKIFLSVVGLELVTAAVILGWYFYSPRSEINSLMLTNAQEAVVRSVGTTEDYFRPFDPAINGTRDLVSRGVLDRGRPEQLVRYLHDQLSRWPQFAGLYVAYPDGGFYYVMHDNSEASGGTRTKIISYTGRQRLVDLTWRDTNYSIVKKSEDPTDTYDARTRPWYKAAFGTSKVVWTKPYIFFTSHKPGITASVAVRDANDQTVAVVGIDIEINQVSKYLRQIAFGKDRSAFVISSDGEIIANSRNDALLPGKGTTNGVLRFPKISDLTDIDQSLKESIAARIPGNPASSAPEVWQEQSKGHSYIIAMSRISNANWPWQIVAVIPKTDIAGNRLGTDLGLFVVGLFTIFAAIAVGYGLARSIGKPLTVLWSNARLARNGNVELMDEVASSYQEIDQTNAILLELGSERRLQGTGRPQTENSTKD